MGFSSQEKDNLLFKTIAAGVVDSNSVAQWYESRFPYENTIDAAKVWTELTTIKQHPAANQTQAETNVVNFLSSQVEAKISTPIHLSPVPGTGDSTFAALSVFNDFSSTRLDNWLAPAYVPQTSGAPSNGYAVRLYEGDPSSGGVEISTTTGISGTGEATSVAWFFSYSMGLLFLSKDFLSSVNPQDLWITGFRYIGETVLDIQGGGASDHGELTGLTDDDHQYYLHTSNNRAVLAVHDFLNGLNVGDGYLSWMENATKPVITQEINQLYDGYDFIIKAQDSAIGSGGNLILSGGNGIDDGYVVVGTGTADVIVVRDDGYIDIFNSILKVGSVTNIPTSNPVDSSYLYVQSGALKARSPSGTITTIAPADPHCPRCGRDFVFDASNSNGEKLTICFWCLSKQIEKLGINPDTFIIDRVEKP